MFKNDKMQVKMNFDEPEVFVNGIINHCVFKVLSLFKGQYTSLHTEICLWLGFFKQLYS